MSPTPMQVLLIEDDPEHADLIKMHMSRKHATDVHIHWVDRLKKGIERLENIKILVIDDSIDSLMLADIILRRNGAIVTKAESAAEGFKILTSTQQDLIVCDISMPEEDGYMFMKRWRAYETEHQLPLIPSAALTAFTRENERKEVFSSGFQAHLTKPIDESALVSSLVGLAGKTKSITYTNSTK